MGGDEFLVILTDAFVSVEAMETELQKEVKEWHGIPVKELSLAYGFVCGKATPK